MSSQHECLGIIGGSGLYQLEEFKLTKIQKVKTPFGDPSAPFKIGTLADVPVVFLARHGEGHVFNPSEINYRANIWALKKLGVRAIFSVSAVGSLRHKIEPGHMVIVDQFIDRTKNRPSTFYENGMVVHMSFANPVSPILREILIKSCRKAKVMAHTTGTYLCMEGPLFSTKAESNAYRQLNADVIGMTNLQEAKLAREAEIEYATLALATDYDCWHSKHDTVTVEQILEVMKKNIKNAQSILKYAVTQFDFSQKSPLEGKIVRSLLTDKNKIPASVVKKLQPLLAQYF